MTTATTSPPAATTPPPPPPPPPTSNRPGLWIALALVALVALGAATLGATAWFVRDVDQGSTTVAAADTIRFRGDTAKLTLVEADRDDIEVAWQTKTSTWREAEVTTEVEDGVLVVSADCPNVLVVMPCSTDTDITVPTGSLAQLDVEIDAGEVRTTGTSAEVMATVDAGDVLLAQHHGTRAVLRVDAGQVEIDSRAVPRELDVVVDVGGLEIAVPEADYDVDATVDMGIVATAVREADDAPHRIRARVDIGDVDVHMR